MKKCALLIGINSYSNAKFNLNGCVNDITSLKDLLISTYGFESSDITMLFDSDATKSNILYFLNQLIDTASEGDTLVFGFSGHGCQVSGLEDDLKDEAIVTYNISMTGLLRDDEYYDVVQKRGDDFLSRINFTSIFDCCHSGTMLRSLVFLPEERNEEHIFEEFINRVIAFEDIAQLDLKEIRVGPFNSLSACADSETAADLKIDGIYRGAFSYALHKILKNNPGISTTQLEPAVLAEIQRVSRHIQNPVYFTIDPDSRIIV